MFVNGVQNKAFEVDMLPRGFFGKPLVHNHSEHVGPIKLMAQCRTHANRPRVLLLLASSALAHQISFT